MGTGSQQHRHEHEAQTLLKRGDAIIVHLLLFNPVRKASVRAARCTIYPNRSALCLPLLSSMLVSSIFSIV
eukprot:4841761-Heterocapsa_arctica.AAC.1